MDRTTFRTAVVAATVASALTLGIDRYTQPTTAGASAGTLGQVVAQLKITNASLSKYGAIGNQLSRIGMNTYATCKATGGTGCQFP
jgi:hypothetical protein